MKKKINKGYTLIELIISMGIIIILSALIFITYVKVKEALDINEIRNIAVETKTVYENINLTGNEDYSISAKSISYMYSDKYKEALDNSEYSSIPAPYFNSIFITKNRGESGVSFGPNEKDFNWNTVPCEKIVASLSGIATYMIDGEETEEELTPIEVCNKWRQGGSSNGFIIK